ncbi:hypothetical protein [Isoptericola sp. AK164]|uniref:hypothetical protein n=1 Tax=Isoptericola sp. AK164 TaxID=3024246 RepID=UPI0024185170|nr:hypothetical protein [Isoptericola sp. AK164]
MGLGGGSRLGRFVRAVTAGAVTVGLALTGALVGVPAAVAADSTTTIELEADRAWRGQVLEVPVRVTQDGAPATGTVWLYVDGTLVTWYRALSDGGAVLTLFTDRLSGGTHEIEVRHMDGESSADCRCSSSATASLEVVEPTTPLLTPDGWYAGESVSPRFDLTGTDLPADGTVELMGSAVVAPLVDGVAELALTGDEVRSPQVRLTHRSPEGDVLSRWLLPVDLAARPVTADVEIPETWRRGETVRIAVDVTSDHGTPTGEASVTYLDGAEGVPLARETLVDGRGELVVDVTDLPVGEQRIEVRTRGGREYENTRAEHVVEVLPPATRVRVSTARRWTYAQRRSVDVDVTSSVGTPEGRVVLHQAGRRIGAADLVHGRASVRVGGKKVDPGRRTIVARFVPDSGEHAPSRTSWTQRVRKAQPTVRLRMRRTTYWADVDLTGKRSGRIVVRTPGMPEVGRLVLQTRDRHATNDGWRTRKSWWLSRSEDGVQRIKVPARYLDKAGGRSGRVHLRVRYVPADREHVAKRRSPRLTIYHY